VVNLRLPIIASQGTNIRQHHIMDQMPLEQYGI